MQDVVLSVKTQFGATAKKKKKDMLGASNSKQFSKLKLGAVLRTALHLSKFNCCMCCMKISGHLSSHFTVGYSTDNEKLSVYTVCVSRFVYTNHHTLI